MEWLIALSEQYREQIRSGPFFKAIANAERPSDLRWVHQLIHQSREFTQALCLRYSLCHDRRYQSIFAEHAFEEADHPDQLLAWMEKHGYETETLVPPTYETLNSLAFCWRSALHDPHDVQVVALNVLSEGVAFDFYSAVIPVLEKLEMLSGRYWKVHRDVDLAHLRLGLDRCGDVAPDSPQGCWYQRVLWQGASLYHQMLASWVGESVQPLEMLPAYAQAIPVPIPLVDSSPHALRLEQFQS
jgi:hypothetical protein